MPTSKTPSEAEQRPLRVLIIEDSEDDAILMIHALKKGGFRCTWQRVQTADALRRQLDSGEWDAILADWNIPRFDAMTALDIVREGVRDIPFIIVSGTIGEETAVAAMKAGANDYVRKDNLNRLVPAMNRELFEFRERQGRRESIQALHAQFQQIATIFNSLDALVYVTDPETRSLLFVNRPGDQGQEMDLPCHQALHDREIPFPSCPDTQVLREGEQAPPIVREFKDETSGTWYQCINRPIRWPDGRLVNLAIAMDITERKAMEQMRAETLSFVSHEMRTPLTAIMGFSDFLLNETVPQNQQQSCLATIFRETERLNKLIDNFLDLQRAESSRRS